MLTRSAYARMFFLAIAAILMVTVAATSFASPVETSLVTDGTILYGQSISEVINGSDPADYWVFRGSKDDVISVTMNRASNGGGNLRPYLHLLGPDGRNIDAYIVHPTKKTATIEQYVLRESGLYTIVATRRGAPSTEGRYDLYLARVEEARQIKCGESREGYLSGSDPIDPFILYAPDKQLSITLSRDGKGMDPYLYLLDYDETEYWDAESDNDGGGGRDAEIGPLRWGGADTFIIYATRLGSGQGGYLLTVACQD